MSSKFNKMSSANSILFKQLDLYLLMTTSNINIQVTDLPKKFYCSKCNKSLSSRQSKWRHENTCSNSNTLETRITQLEKFVIPSIQSGIKYLDIIITNIKTTYSIISNNYFNKTIIANEQNFNFIINNSIDIYNGISNQLPSKSITIRTNLKYLNKLKPLSVKHQNYSQYIDKLKTNTSDKINKYDSNSNSNSDYESDSSLDTDISDF